MKIALLVPVFTVLAACAAEPSVPVPPPAPAPIDVSAPPVVADPAKETSAGYAIGVKKITDKRGELQALIDAGKLDELHKVAEELSATAKALPSTCESLGAAQRDDVAAHAQKLQDLFGPVDEAGDAGKREESAAAIAAYDAPISALKAYLP